MACRSEGRAPASPVPLPLPPADLAGAAEALAGGFAGGVAPAGAPAGAGVAGLAVAAVVGAGVAGAAAAGAGAAATASAAVTASTESNFNSTGGDAGASAITPTSLVTGAKPSISTRIVQTPSARS